MAETKAIQISKDAELVSESNVKSALKEIEKANLKLTILMAGKTNVGKTTLIKAIISGKYVDSVSNNSESENCTKYEPIKRTVANIQNVWKTESGEIVIADVPGFGEANAGTIGGLNYEENIRQLGQHAHLVIIVLKGDDRALELEERFVNAWQNDERLNKIPVFVVVNQIDKIPPSRGNWEPDNLNLEQPSTAREQAIHAHLEYISDIPVFRRYALAGHIFPACAGEFPGDRLYGIEDLRVSIIKSLPKMYQALFADAIISSNDEADEIIRNTALVCAAIAAINPIPLVDSVLFTIPQVRMVRNLARLRGINLTWGTAIGLLNSAFLSAAAQYTFLDISSAIPIIKQVVGPFIAFSLTYGSGLIVDGALRNKKTHLTDSEANALAREFAPLVERKADDYKAASA